MMRGACLAFKTSQTLLSSRLSFNLSILHKGLRKRGIVGCRRGKTGTANCFKAGVCFSNLLAFPLLFSCMHVFCASRIELSRQQRRDSAQTLRYRPTVSSSGGSIGGFGRSMLDTRVSRCASPPFASSCSCHFHVLPSPTRTILLVYHHRLLPRREQRACRFHRISKSSCASVSTSRALAAFSQAKACLSWQQLQWSPMTSNSQRHNHYNYRLSFVPFRNRPKQNE